jgi:uncharacterized delta-60 repeat protein
MKVLKPFHLSFLLFLFYGELWGQVPGTEVSGFGIKTMQNSWTCAKVNPLSDGRVLATGSQNYKARVWQFTPTGILDVNFATAGIWSQNSIEDVEVFDAFLQPEGSLLMIGMYESFISGRWLPWIKKLSSDGQNVEDIFIPGPASGDQSVLKMVGCKGKTGDNLLAYTQGPTSSLGTTALRIFRINSEGQPSGGFTVNGISLVPPNPTKLYELKAVAEDSSGNIWAFGRITNFGVQPDSLFLAKLLAGGIPDLDFGSKGFKRIAPLPGTITPAGLTTGPGPTIVLSASVDSAAFFVRYLANGSEDISFGNSGFFKKRFPGNGFLYDHILLPDGRLVGCGTALKPGFAYDYFLTRLNQNGTSDSSFFDSTGTRIFGGVQYDLFRTISLDSQGHIVAGGQTGPTFGESIATVGKFYSGNAVSISRNSEKTTFSLYPNPAEESTFIQNNSPIKRVSICDAFGSIVAEASQSLSPQSNKNLLNISGIKPGIYWVKVQTDEGVRVQKLLKK